MSKPAHGSVRESLEVVWEAIHQWSADIQEYQDEHEPTEDNAKLSMNIIMDNLGFAFDENGDLTEKALPSSRNPSRALV